MVYWIFDIHTVDPKKEKEEQLNLSAIYDDGRQSNIIVIEITTSGSVPNLHIWLLILIPSNKQIICNLHDLFVMYNS